MIGVALLLALLVMGAQAGSMGNPNRETASNTYVEAMIGAPRWVNPLLAVSDTDRDLAHLVFSGLLRVDENGNLAGDMASAWQAAPDSAVFTYTLKPDLVWHDGQPVTIGDVLYTIGLLQNEDFPGDPALALPWKSVTTSSPLENTIVFKLPSPNASFPQYTTLGILPRHIWASVKPGELFSSPANVAPIGTGAWRYAQLPAQTDATGATTFLTSTISGKTAGAVEASEGVLLVRAYSAAGDHNGIERIWFRLYPSFGAALTGFEMGEVHGLGHIAPEDLASVEAVPGVELHTQNLARYNMLILNMESPLFDKLETRKAIALALDRNAMAGDAEARLAAPLYGPVLPHSWAYSVECAPTQSQSIGEARTLLDTAGWTLNAEGVRTRNGVTMTVVLAANSDVPANVVEAQEAVDNLRALGIDARLAAVTREVFLKEYVGPRAFHIALAGWEASGADPDLYGYWHSSQAKTGGLNFAQWTNKTADAALDTIHNSADLNARKTAFCDFQRTFTTDIPAVVLSTPLYTYATRNPAVGISLPDKDLLSPADRFDTISAWSLVPVAGVR